MNKLLVYIFIITFFSCKGQEKQDNLIDTKVNIDKLLFDDYIYKSSVLDRLFKQTHGLYIEGEKNGAMETEEFNCLIISILNNKKQPIKTYALFFDKKDVLRDTLSIANKDMSLKVSLENNKKGIALGEMDLKKSYFKITNLYEISSKLIKLKKNNLATKILKCEIPINYLTEEYIGLEDYFDFGITNKINNKPVNDILFERNQSSPEGLISSSFYRDKNDSLQINTETLDYISKNTTRENSAYLFALENYVQKNREDLGWSHEEFAKIKGFIFNTTYPLRKKYWADKFDEWYGGKPEELLGSGSYWQENNYYGLPKLEEYERDFRITYW